MRVEEARKRAPLTIWMLIWQPVMLVVLILKMWVTLLALLGSEILMLWAFVHVAQLVLKIHAGAVLAPINWP